MSRDTKFVSIEDIEIDAGFESKTVFVDMNRTDSYSEDGSVVRPYKTLQAAVDRVEANGDNALLVPYLIEVVPGDYTGEGVIDLNKASFVNITIKSQDSGPYETSVAGFDCTATNDGFRALKVDGFDIPGPISLVGASNTTNFANVGFIFWGCTISGPVTVWNAGISGFMNCSITAPLNIQNVGAAFFQIGSGISAVQFDIMWDDTANKPAGVTDTRVYLDSIVCLADPVNIAQIGPGGTSNLDLVKSLGADKVIDYKKEDSINRLETYDFVFDAVGESKSSALKVQCGKALAQGGRYKSVDDGLLKYRAEYLVQLKELIEAGKVKAVIDSRYTLEQIIEAHRYVDKGHKKGNVVITVAGSK